MSVKGGSAALLALTLAATAVGAQARGAAQGGAARPAAPACDITSSGSEQVTGAYESLSAFNEAQSEAEKPGHLRKATELLTSPPDKPGVDLARQWVLAQTLVAWTLVEGQASSGPRGTFGFVSNPEQPVDLLVVADSLLTLVGNEKPGCAEQIDNMRRLPYVNTANAAVAQFNAGNTDSARVLAERASVIYPNGAPTQHLLANIAVREQDFPRAAEAFERAAEMAKDDESLGEVRSGALESLTAIYSNLAQQAEGDEQRAYGQKAVAAYRQLIELQPDNAALQTGLAQALAVAGDTTAVAGMNAGMLASPQDYSSMQLLDAAIGAANANRFDDAAGLIEAGLARNPYYRDGLFVGAYVFAERGEHAKSIDMAKRLIEVDPSNPDNYGWLVQGYTNMLEGTSDRGVQRALTDSMVKAQAAASQVPAKVTFTDFQVGTTNLRVLNGAVENLRDEDANVTLDFEFVNEQGAVVATHQETVSAIAGRQSKPFSISVQGDGIAAFRYRTAAPGAP